MLRDDEDRGQFQKNEHVLLHICPQEQTHPGWRLTSSAMCKQSIIFSIVILANKTNQTLEHAWKLGLVQRSRNWNQDPWISNGGFKCLRGPGTRLAHPPRHRFQGRKVKTSPASRVLNLRFVGHGTLKPCLSQPGFLPCDSGCHHGIIHLVRRRPTSKIPALGK